MATKKAKASKKTTAKKTADAAKPAKKKTTRKKAERVREGKGVVVFFMGKLIQAGYLGEEIPEESKERGRAAQTLRQMAEKLARQTRRFGDEDIALGGEDD